MRPYDAPMASVQTNGITIEYDERGEGEPLLLVMGLGGQLIDWHDDFVDLLADAGFRVIRFDNRDSGLSAELQGDPPTRRQIVRMIATRRRPTAPYLLTDMARDGVGLLDVLGIHAAHVVGMSMGGMIAQTMAIEHPARVRSLTSVMSTTGDRRRGRIHRSLMVKAARLPEPSVENAVDNGVQMFRLIGGSEFDEGAVRDAVQRAVARSFRPAGTGRQMAAILASPDRTPALRRVTAPTLVIHGLMDKLVQPSGGMATARAVPGSRLVMYPEMGHDLPRSRWAEIIEEIRRNAARATTAHVPVPVG